MEPGQPAEAEAIRRAGNGQPGPQHDRGHAFKRCVVSGFAVFAGATRLLVAADKEDAVVRPGGDRQHRQDVRGERGEPKGVVVTENRDDSARARQRDEGHEQLDQCGDERAVDQQQHDRDRAQGEQRDFGQAVIADDVHVVRQRRRAGDVSHDPGRRGLVVDDLADGLDGFVGLRGALVTGDIDLDIGSLGIGALSARRGEPVTPEVLDVLDVLGVLAQFAHDVVVVAVRGVAERLLTFHHDHDRAVGTELVEVVPHPHHRLIRRRFQGRHWRGMVFADDFQARNGDVDHDSQRDPGQDDRNREDANEMRDKRAVRFGCCALRVGVGHADFTRQNVWALWPSELRCSRSSPSTVMRQPM